MKFSQVWLKPDFLFFSPLLRILLQVLLVVLFGLLLVLFSICFLIGCNLGLVFLGVLLLSLIN